MEYLASESGYEEGYKNAVHDFKVALQKLDKEDLIPELDKVLPNGFWEK